MRTPSLRSIVIALAALLVLLAAVSIAAVFSVGERGATVDSFERCVAAGNPVMESYPERCRSADGRVFVRDIGNELEKADLIRLARPRPGDSIASPLIVEGEARGFWFFEASFPVKLFDKNGAEIPMRPGYVMASDEWMTTEFVPFRATLEFDAPAAGRGTLMLQKDNPSGLPEHDDALFVPVLFRR